MRQIQRRHKLARALSKRRVAFAEPKTWQREALHVTSTSCLRYFVSSCIRATWCVTDCDKHTVPHVNHFHVELQRIRLGVFAPLLRTPAAKLRPESTRGLAQRLELGLVQGLVSR